MEKAFYYVRTVWLCACVCATVYVCYGVWCALVRGVAVHTAKQHSVYVKQGQNLYHSTLTGSRRKESVIGICFDWKMSWDLITIGSWQCFTEHELRMHLRFCPSFIIKTLEKAFKRHPRYTITGRMEEVLFIFIHNTLECEYIILNFNSWLIEIFRLAKYLPLNFRGLFWLCPQAKEKR